MVSGLGEVETSVDSITPAAIEQAADELAQYLAPTPLQYSRAFTAKAGCHVHIKDEAIQPIRAFKVRGALNKMAHLHPEERSAGVITASAGNHGQGVAYAAQVFRTPATVFVPESANPLKVEAIKRYGARVVHAGRSYQDAYLEAVRAQAESGATFVHAFDDPHVIAGQGTIAVELVNQLEGFDTVLVPVGGGGLISGIALYLKARRPGVRVIGVEPAGANGLARSLEAGRIVTLDTVSTIADGLAASAPGRLCFEIARRHVDQVLVVAEDEMLRAIKLYFEWEHLLAEPAGAAALAALLYHYNPAPSERVVVLLSGANVTDEVLIRALTKR
jgi:threonine dehydratase